MLLCHVTKFFELSVGDWLPGIDGSHPLTAFANYGEGQDLFDQL